MTLSDWIAQTGITHAEAGRRLGVAHTTVARWCAGDFFPSGDNLRSIKRVTRGAVLPNDFMQPEEQP